MDRSPILVTGGAGFIGSHVCDALLRDGERVRCMDSFITGRRENIEHLLRRDDFELIEADVRSPDQCHRAVRDVRAVLHLAALGSVPRSIDDPLATEAANLSGTLNMLEAVRHAGVRRFIYASSSSVYGGSTVLPKREGTEGRPLSPYAVTKSMDEAYAGMYHRLFGVEVIGLRFFNVFGERQDPEGPYAAAIPRFIRDLFRHRAPQVHGDGRQTRDFTYVGNAAQAMLDAMRCEDPRAIGRVFNIAYGQSTDLLALIERLKSAAGKIDPVIADIGVEHVPERAGDVRDSMADITAARELLGYRPAFDLERGLERAVPWYAAHWT